MSGTWPVRRVFSMRAWHLKNAVRRKAVFCGGRPKRHCWVLTFLAPWHPLLPSLSHVFSHHHKKIHLSHISQWPICEQRASVLRSTLQALLRLRALCLLSGHFRITGMAQVSEYRLTFLRREQFCPWFCVLFWCFRYHDVSVSKGTFQSTGMFLYFLGSPYMESMGKPPLIDTINEKEEQKHDLGGILLSVATSRRLWSHKGLLQIYKDSTNII